VAWLLAAITGQAADAAVTIAIATTPALARIRPKTDLARVTVTALLHGAPLGQGHITLHLTAPPRTKVISTGLPRVEGTPLLTLGSEFSNGTFTFQYVFPIRGLYTLDLEIAPVPEGPAFPPTRLRQTVRIAEQPVVVRQAWLRIGGLFVLGAVAGVPCTRAAAARKKRRRQAIVGLLGLCYGVLASGSTVAAHPGHPHGVAQAAQGHQVIRGDDGWELEIHTSPEPATVGELVQLDLWLRKDGAVFPGTTKVAVTVTSLEAGQTVVETHVLAREGQTTQRLQLYNGGWHAIAVTVHPAGGAPHGWVPPTVVLNVDVVALPPPLAVQLKMTAMVLGVLAVGMAVGVFVPRLALGTGL
jgi:hypothetical protein